MKYAIIIPTYFRPDGKTKNYLERCLNTVHSQTHKDYHVFLIGDNYTNNTEFEKLSKTIIDKNKITAINLPIAVERERYQYGTRELWCTGGINASNIGIDLALRCGFNYCCHLDHDDTWYADHLLTIDKTIQAVKDAVVVYTMSEYRSPDKVIPLFYKDGKPYIIADNKVIKSIPTPTNVIRSSVCIDFSRIHLRYRDVRFKSNNTKPALEGDIDLWNRLKDYLNTNNLNSYLAKRVTVSHLEEGYAKT